MLIVKILFKALWICYLDLKCADVYEVYALRWSRWPTRITRHSTGFKGLITGHFTDRSAPPGIMIISALYEELIGSLYFGLVLGHTHSIYFQIPNRNIFWNLDLLRVKVIKIYFKLFFLKIQTTSYFYQYINLNFR